MLSASALIGGGVGAGHYDYHDPIMDLYVVGLLGRPYIWGGDDPLVGFDCSGFVIEVLRSKGVLPKGWEAGITAKTRSGGLFEYYEKGGRADVLPTPRQGALVFYGKSVTQITHVAWAMNTESVAEYAGGGPDILTAEDAAKANAYGRIRPFDHRGDKVAILRPKYRGTLIAVK